MLLVDMRIKQINQCGHKILECCQLTSEFYEIYPNPEKCI